jgi:DNA-binding CsgD family transcriptional regulator
VLLKKETESKSQEIERMAMVLAEKTELIRSTGNRIVEIVKDWNGDKRLEFDRLLSELKFDSIKDEQAIFNAEFQHIHGDILRKLSTRHSALSLMERKICMLLREGFCTKEVASMMKVPPRVIEWRRYKMRQKMKLDRETSLSTVLAAI